MTALRAGLLTGVLALSLSALGASAETVFLGESGVWLGQQETTTAVHGTAWVSTGEEHLSGTYGAWDADLHLGDSGSSGGYGLWLRGGRGWDGAHLGEAGVW